MDLLSDLCIRKIHAVSTMYSERGAGTHRADRPLWALVIKYEGETRYTCDGKEFLSDLRHITLLPRGCSYDWVCTAAGHFCIAELECETSCPAEILTFPVRNGEIYRDALQRMEVRRALKKPGYLLEEMRDMYGLLASLLKTKPEYVPAKKEKKIYPALSYMAENFHTHLHVEDLSAVAGLSPVYFRKLFRAVTGMSPIRYLVFLRMEKAKEMLQSDYSSITDIAVSLGYNNVYEFSRGFKKYTGKSPLQYGKENAGNP